MLRRFASCTAGMAVLAACAPGEDTARVADAKDEDVLTLETAQGTLSATTGEAMATGVGIVGVANVDADDGDGWMDFSRPTSAEDDVVAIIVPAAAFEGLAYGEGLSFELYGDVQYTRLWGPDAVLVGNDGESAKETGVLEATGSDVTLLLEFGAVLAQAELVVRHPGTGEVIETRLTSAPMIMSHHLQPVERLWSMPMSEFGGDNTQMMQTYADELGGIFEPVDAYAYEGDAWLQDEFEMASITAPGVRMDVVWDIIRDRGLADMPREVVLQDDDVLGVWGNPWEATSLDYGGNLEATPPLSAHGVHYPFGRIYYGADGWAGPVQEFTDMLDSQRVQAPFAVDSSWLCVGHVDEFVTTIPDPSARLGWKLVIADTELAWQLLLEMDPSTSLPMFNGHKPWTSVSDLLSDPALYALNQDIQAYELDPALEVFVDELDLTEDDILRIPQLFETPNGCGDKVASLFPGMANMVVAPLDDGTTKLFIPDPFVRETTSQQSDPFIQHVEQVFPADHELFFVDDFEVYHLLLGEVHCGTNVQRTPQGAWWESAGHLLSSEVY